MQEVHKISIEYPKDIKCFKGNQAYSICCQKKCTQYPFICKTKNCQCMIVTHRDCVSVCWESIADRVLSKKQQTDENFEVFSKQVIKIYNECIQRLQNEKKFFNDWTRFVGLNQYERVFAKLIQDKQISKLTGSVMFNIIEQINEKIQLEKPQPDLIAQYWKNHQNKLNSLVKQIKGIYLWPCGFFPLSLKQHEDKIFKLFDKSPTRFILRYQASKHNFSMKKFHQLCDNIPNTLTVILQTNGSLAGGYTPIPWNHVPYGVWVDDQQNQTFKFLEQERDLRKSQASSSNCVFHYIDWGPSFGAGRDLIVYAPENKEQTEFTTVTSYQGRAYDLFCPQGTKITKAKPYADFWVFQILWQ